MEGVVEGRQVPCSHGPHAPHPQPWVLTLDEGFMRAESAVIGRRVGAMGDAMSTMTTEF